MKVKVVWVASATPPIVACSFVNSGSANTIIIIPTVVASNQAIQA